MVVFGKKRTIYGPPLASFLADLPETNYQLLLKIFHIKSAMQLNIIHCFVIVLFYIELFLTFSFLVLIKNGGNVPLSYKYFIFIGGFEAIYLLFRFNTLPYWVDDDKVEKTTTIVFSEQSSDDFIKDIVDKDIQNIRQNQIAVEIAHKSTKKIGKKNKIIIKIPKSLDLKNNTIILPSKPKQTKTNDEE